MKKPKVIVIGLDGATWDLIKPWVDEGKLPTFKHLMENGAWGALESTIPPVTFPAWHSLFTGQNPGKLGVYNFVQIDVKNRKFIVNTPKSFKGKPVWKILSEYGYKSCVINVPTAKVEKINGVIVGGAFADGDVYPPEYKRILNEIGYKAYPEELTKAFLKSGVEPNIELIKQTISSRFELAKLLVEKEKPDFLALVIFEIDSLQHFYWGDDILYQAWKHIDNKIGSFISDYINDSYIFIVSDHGFAFTETYKTLFISKFLEDLGLIKFKRSIEYKILSTISTEKIIRIAKKLKLDITKKILPLDFILRILSAFPDEGGRLGAKGLESVIDWENSIAVPIDRLIYLSCSDTERNKLKEYLKKKLEELDIVDRVLYKEEVCSGKYLDSAPDLVVMTKKGVDVLENPFVRDVVVNGLVRPNWKAMHDINGIFLALGPRIKTTNLKASIYDITPTILSIFGIPVDPDVDGKVLSAIFSDKVQLSIKGDSLEKFRIKSKIKELKGKLGRRDSYVESTENKNEK